MPTMKMKIETDVSVEKDFIHIYAHEDEGLSEDALVTIAYGDLRESVLDDLEAGDLNHTEALELAAKFAKVAEDIRTYVRDDLLRTGRDE